MDFPRGLHSSPPDPSAAPLPPAKSSGGNAAAPPGPAGPAPREATDAAEETCRLLFRLNPLPMWVFDRESLRFLAVNEAAVRDYGYSETEFLQLRVTDIRTAAGGPELLAALNAETAATTSGRTHHRKKDGAVIEVEFTSHRFDFEGRPGRLVLARDITAEKAAQEKLREQAALLQCAPDGIVVRDLGHVIHFWNHGAERLYGWSEAEAAGQRLDQLLQVDAAAFRAAMEVLLATGEWAGELSVLTRRGATLTMNCRWSLLRTTGGEPKSILGFDSDITDRKKLEAQFMRAQRLESIGTLAGGIAHDLNNLLAPITMAVDLLKEEVKSPDGVHVLEILDRSARRSAGLVRQVLAFARGAQGARLVVQIRHVVNELAGIVDNTFPKNVRMQTHVPADSWPILGDATQIQQVLLNLSVNARDAMPDGGHLHVRVRNAIVDEQYVAMSPSAAAGRYLAIEVEDNGTGIAKESLDKIFDPFFTTKEAGKGSGLGLTTSLAIVRGHKGFIEVSSEVGKGSTFRVYLPAEAGVSPSGDESPAQALPRGNGELILVVDDEPAVLTVTRQTLETFGYRVVTADNGAEAVGVVAAERGNIAVVITDMMMPIMDGPASVLAMRKINPQLKIIGASGLDTVASSRAASAGIVHFLPKPFSTGALLTLLRVVLAGGPAGSR